MQILQNEKQVILLSKSSFLLSTAFSNMTKQIIFIKLHSINYFISTPTLKTLSVYIPSLSEMGRRTSMTSWWALDTSVRALLWLNVSDISCPNVYPAPRGEIPQPPRSSGSDQSRSHMGPWNQRGTGEDGNLTPHNTVTKHSTQQTLPVLYFES